MTKTNKQVAADLGAVILKLSPEEQAAMKSLFSDEAAFHAILEEQVAFHETLESAVVDDMGDWDMEDITCYDEDCPCDGDASVTDYGFNEEGDDHEV